MNQIKLESRAMPVACLAPPLTDSKLEQYRGIITKSSEGPVKDAATKLLVCVETWWNLPESKRTDGPRLKLLHRPTQGQERVEKTIELVPIEKDHQKTLYDLIPWDYELNAMDALFDSVPNDTQKELRDAAFHLLWFVRELNLDREPLTADKL